MAMDKCTNCSATIGEKEAACVFGGNVVCVNCDRALRAMAEKREREKLKFDLPAAATSRQSQPSSASPKPEPSYFGFDKIVAPEIIKVMHGLVFAAAIVVSIGSVLGGLSSNEDKSKGFGIAAAMVLAVWMSYLWFRVLCEFLIVQFKIRELLEK
jgi:hypothetical protein